MTEIQTLETRLYFIKKILQIISLCVISVLFALIVVLIGWISHSGAGSPFYY